MRFEVFGKRLFVERRDDRWVVFHMGEGTLREAHDLIVPPDIAEADLETSLADLLHEHARPGADTVRRLD